MASVECEPGVNETHTTHICVSLLAPLLAPIRSAMTAQRVCTKMAGVCKKVPSWPEGKVRKNEQFKPRDPKDDDLEKLLESMKGIPGGGGLSMMRPGDMDLGDDKIDEIDVLKDEL